LNILYQRSLLIDPMAVLAGVLSFYSLLCFFRSDRKECPVFSWASLSTFAATSWIVVMMKALYLWPTILLLGYLVIRSRARYSGQLLAILIILFFCGISFIAWNFHAMQINNNSPITAGIKPTTLLGASALIDPQFYVSMIIRRPKIWLGPLAAAAYPLGLWAIFRKPLERRFAPFALVAVIPPSYLLVFANINNPHDYYQLITTPFLSIIAAEGLLWTASHILPCRLATPSLIGVLAIITTIFYIGWLHAPKVDQRPIAFQKLCKNLSKPLAPGMVFVSTNKYFVPHRSIPEFIYASGLWGEGKVVDNPADAYRVYQRSLAGFTKVDNLVFYGTEKPDWIPTNLFRLSAEDKASGFFAFRSLSSRF
jgi:hypothetical protein